MEVPASSLLLAPAKNRPEKEDRWMETIGNNGQKTEIGTTDLTNPDKIKMAKTNLKGIRDFQMDPDS